MELQEDSIIVSDRLDGIIDAEIKNYFTHGAVQAVVRKGSKAYRKGIRTGDYLVSANGIPISDICTYVSLSYKEKVTRMVLRTPENEIKEVAW